MAEDDEWGVLKAGCVNHGRFDPDEHKALPPDLEPRREYEVQHGDLLMSRANTKELLGSAAMVGEVRSRLLLCDKLYRIRPVPSRMESRFLVYQLASSDVRHQIERSTTGASASMQNISQDLVGDLEVHVPAVEVQRAIADFLDRKTVAIDALIAKKKRMLELLAEKRAAIIHRAVTKGLDPSVPMKDSGVPWIGEIPAHWAVKRLKFLGEVRGGVTKGRDLSGRETLMVPYLRVANVQDGFVDLSDVAEIEVTPSDVPRYQLQSGDILMNEGGDNDKLGRGCVWEGQVSPCLHQNHVFAVRPHAGTDPYWVSICTTAEYLRFFFLSQAKQSTNLASISSTNLKEAPILVPPDQERADILRWMQGELGRTASMVAALQASVAGLHEYRQALITAAVTGQLDLTAVEATPLPEPEPLAAEPQLPLFGATP